MAYKSDSFFRARNDSGKVPMKLLEDSKLHKSCKLYNMNLSQLYLKCISMYKRYELIIH